MTGNRRYGIIAIFVLIAGSIACCSGKVEEAVDRPEMKLEVNLLENPSFEKWNGSVPEGWEIRHFSGDGSNRNKFGKSTHEKKSGRSSFYLRGLFNTDKWMVLTQKHPVSPGYDLLISADIKVVNIQDNKGQSKDANIYIIFYDSKGKRLNDRYYADDWTHPRTGTSDWRRDVKKVEIPEKAYSAEFGLINRMTGYVYFDNVMMKIKAKVKWNEKDTKFITFQWLDERPFPEGAIEKEAEMIEGFADRVGIKKIKEKIKYRLYPSPERFMQILERSRYHQTSSWSGREIHTIEPFEDHEMIHHILYDLGYPPVGLAKGLVFSLRSQYRNWDIHSKAKQYLIQKKIPALYKTIPQQLFLNSNANVTVPAWGSFVTYLIDRFGMDKFIEFYKSVDKIDEVGPFNVHFKDIYGEEFPDADREWRLFLMRYQADPNADTMP